MAACIRACSRIAVALSWLQCISSVGLLPLLVYYVFWLGMRRITHPPSLAHTPSKIVVEAVGWRRMPQWACETVGLQYYAWLLVD